MREAPVLQITELLHDDISPNLYYVHQCLASFAKQIGDVDDGDAQVVWRLCHTYIKLINNLDQHSYMKDYNSEPLVWREVCEKISTVPEVISEFLYILVAASIACDCLVHAIVDHFLLEFIFRLIDPSTEDDILDSVFSLFTLRKRSSTA